MKSFLKKLYHKYIKKTPIYTVQLRGRLSAKDAQFLKSVKKKYMLSPVQISKKIKVVSSLIFFEVGFGNGSHVVELAKANKNALVVGSEMYLAGVVNTLRSRERENLENLYVSSADARTILNKMSDCSLDRAYVLFPDPWPKVRHNKRRLVKRDFINVILLKLRFDGLCIVATDWAEYATEIEEVIEDLVKEKRVEHVLLPSTETAYIHETTFAQRAKKEGRKISLFILKKI